ncbi:MAG: hypothetical protein ACI3Y0_13795 [Prevotella sp.]
MNKRFGFGAALVIVCLVSMFSSCMKHSGEIWTQQEIDQAKYEQAFVKRFGQPASNQNWGFGTVVTKSMGVRSANPNGNMWESEGWNVPEALTDAQKDIVRQFFQQNKQPHGISINYSDFFVQQVYKGATNTTDSQTSEVYKAANGGDVTGSNMMNKLTAGSDNDHINNFNYGTCNDWNGLMLMVDSKTDCFGFSNSNDEGRQYNDQYVIISGDDIMQWARTNGKQLKGADVSGMYFVGFDFEALPSKGTGNYTDEWGNSTLTNTNQWLGFRITESTPGAVEKDGKWYLEGAVYFDNNWWKLGGADGYYSDWIVRIVPGTKNTDDGDAVRVIAEDLSVDESGDFDFNDVVFDVKFNSPQEGQTTIVLQAAGGTLPLTVGGHEVHEEFGVSTQTMVNTGAGATVAPKSFVINAKITDANQVQVYVQKNGTWIELTAIQGRVPGKIAVPVTYEWCAEREDIERKYSKFKDYVSQPQLEWWK